ncbi:MAG TPA: DUF3667 domain-containing protein [Cellvibrionaceae bacterium]
MPAAQHRLPTHCQNCHTLLQGTFCHECGQENKHYLRNIFGILVEFLGDFSNWDSRLWRSLLPLWIKPGYLSRRYADGHRAPYIPPLRMYLFTSILAFLAFAFLLPTPVFDRPPEFVANPQRDQAWTVDDQRIDIPFMSEAFNRQLEEKVVLIAQEPQRGVDKFFSLTPQMMILLLPVFALMLKVLYIRRQHYYMEHIILALYSHSFVLQLLMLHACISWLLNSLSPANFLLTPLGYLAALMLWIIPLYLLIGQKVYYGQSWPVTAIKFVLAGLVYSLMLLTAVVCVLILSVLWG